MAIPVVMPKLGWNMEAGTVVEWLKRDGERVNAGEMLLLVESDKATTEVESLDSGVLRLPPDGPAIGQELPVGTVLGYLVEDGERPPFDQQPASRPEGTRRQRAADTAQSVGAVHEPPSPQHSPAASPRAIRVAGELGVDWTHLTGTGMGGRIVERDVRAAAEQSAASSQQPAASTTAPDAPRSALSILPEGRTHSALSVTRRVIGERMVASMRTVAPVTLTTEADATALVRLRTEIAAALGGAETTVPTYNDLFARLVALALREFPDMNASFADSGIVRHDNVHIGIAVDTEKGLLVPVIRDAHAKSVGTIATEAAQLIARTQAGTATRDDLSGGTFTITNLGMYGIDAFTPIINLPECAILGIGRIVARPVVVDEDAETVAVRKMMTLSLTFDHRIVDGAPAARFLKRITQFVEQPLVWLTR